MKRALLIAAVFVAIPFGTSGCGSGGAPRKAVEFVRRPAQGHLVGFVFYSHGGAPAHLWPNTTGLVVAYDAHGRIVARQRVRRGHHFNLRLAPGRYRLGFNERPPKDTGGCPSEIATVHPGRKTFQVLRLNCSLL